jgi:hypothetical protein
MSAVGGKARGITNDLTDAFLGMAQKKTPRQRGAKNAFQRRRSQSNMEQSGCQL